MACRGHGESSAPLAVFTIFAESDPERYSYRRWSSATSPGRHRPGNQPTRTSGVV